VNYKQIHLQLKQQLQKQSLDTVDREHIQQRLHYIETEYAYKPKYTQQQLKPYPKNKRSKR